MWCTCLRGLAHISATLLKTLNAWTKPGLAAAFWLHGGTMDSVKQGCSNTRAKLHVAHNRAANGFDAALSKAGAPQKGIDLIHHLLSMLKDQIGAVLPISLLQV